MINTPMKIFTSNNDKGYANRNTMYIGYQEYDETNKSSISSQSWKM